MNNNDTTVFEVDKFSSYTDEVLHTKNFQILHQEGDIWSIMLNNKKYQARVKSYQPKTKTYTINVSGFDYQVKVKEKIIITFFKEIQPQIFLLILFCPQNLSVKSKFSESQRSESHCNRGAFRRLIFSVISKFFFNFFHFFVEKSTNETTFFDPRSPAVSLSEILRKNKFFQQKLEKMEKNILNFRKKLGAIRRF